MEFYEAASFLFDLRRYPSRAGLDAPRALLAALDDPQADLDCIQIAGSNGKGSTARMTERVLREAGLDVGLYTSPHLSDVRERVRINGRKVTKGAVVAFVEAAHDHVLDAAGRGDCPTFFETMTALALWEFARQDVDVAVLEVGIGGRYDATSVVSPMASAVTSVSLEHTDLLGDTVEAIARDKAQVAPDDGPLVTGASGAALATIEEVADRVVTVGEEGSDVVARYEGREALEGRVSLAGDGWSVDARLPQLGAHQAANAGIAAALARSVAAVSERSLARGLQNAHWPGRFEVMSREPLTVLDGAHNPGGCATVAATLEEFDYDDLHLVFGAMADKDHVEMVTALPDAAHVYTCRPDTDRAESPSVLARTFAERAGVVHESGNVPGALDAALDAAGPDDCVLVAGSLYTVAEARERWTRVEFPKHVRDLEGARATLADADVTEPGVWRMRGKGVHRVLKTRVRPRQARYLKEEMLSLDGECAVSGLSSQDREPVDVVLMGTLAQHKRLCANLDGQPYGLTQLARSLRETLGFDAGGDDPDYPWEERPCVMGILNVTPDSFHDGGEYDTVEAAVARAESMVEAGADIVDVGGESTRPGATPVPVEEECDRVVPVVERLAPLDVLVSVDTRKAAVARAALEAGADVLNDVSGLEDPEMRHVAAEYDAPIVVMHSVEAPVDPETDVEYDDVVEDVVDALAERVLLAEKAGLDRSQILVDPGLGFAKSRHENFELLGRIDEFHALGCPVLVGHSHKSMFDLLGCTPDERLAPTVAGTAIAAERGADVIRVHDVPENVAAVRAHLAATDPDRF
ncbi:dihydropteroate synthase [Halomarina ordinaria]|uniref:Probable bifunctional folylpolyglutamate synthase/dihydropteroate synthase n=1 Tax=Halomarina ordinaria TaxID=3033939 RepID=A0ABD5UDX8_9EURY|nr:dihydropteroate synthase [Halomarina sp. PSRA2]